MWFTSLLPSVHQRNRKCNPHRGNHQSYFLNIQSYRPILEIFFPISPWF